MRKILIHCLESIGLKVLLSEIYFHLRTIGIKKVKPQIIRSLPHDSTAFTQGLVYYNHTLYESTGLVGHSRLRCIDPENGNLINEIEIDGEWCEGIAVVNNRLIQLTYTSGRAIVYDVNSLKPYNEFSYEGEGWGLARCGNLFLMSNGTNRLFYRDENFKIISELPVWLNQRQLNQINDIECVGDKIFANVLFENCIYEIDNKTGRVRHIIDCREIVKNSGRRNAQDVLNGIAYVPSTKTFYITGKCWPMLFEILIPE